MSRLAAQWTGQELQPYCQDVLAFHFPVSLAPSTTYRKGELIAPVGSAAANDVQTITGTNGTGGTFTLSGVHPVSNQAFTTAAIAYNATAAQVAAAVQAAIAACGVTGIVSGATAPTLGWGILVTATGGVMNTNPVVLTFTNAAGTLYLPVPLLTADATLETGSSPTITIAHTTTGHAAGLYLPYSGTTITAPTAPPTVNSQGSNGSFGAGNVQVAYTWVNANGETTPSPAVAVPMTNASQNLGFAAISNTNTPTTATGVNVYLNGQLSTFIATNAAAIPATYILGANTGLAAIAPPTVNTAYTDPNGSGCHNAKAILPFACITDASGNITIGTSVNTGVPDFTKREVPAWFGGVFDTSEIPGLTAAAVTALGGKLIAGTVSAGLVKF